MADASSWGVGQLRGRDGRGVHRFYGGLDNRLFACRYRCWLAAFPKGFRDVCGSPFGITYFLLVLAKERAENGERQSKYYGQTKGEGIETHRLPWPTILENVQDVEECGRGEKFLGRISRRGSTSIFIICRGENPRGKVLYVCRGRALDGDGVGGANGCAEILERGKESREEGTVRRADGLEGDANLGSIISTYDMRARDCLLERRSESCLGRTPIRDNRILCSGLVCTLKKWRN